MMLITRDRLKRYDAYVRELVSGLKRHVGLALLLFGLGALAGYTDIFHTSQVIKQMMLGMIEPFMAFTGVALFVRIFLHNVVATALAMYSGIFLGVFPMASVVLNGLVLGFFFRHDNGLTVLSTMNKFISLLPHGVFEIPAAVLALAMGLKLGAWPLADRKKEYIKTSVTAVSRGYVSLIVPLLLIAALIETVGIEAIRYVWP